MMLNVVKMALLAAIVLIATNVVDPYKAHPTKRFAFSAVAVSMLVGFGAGFDVAALLVVLAILNTTTTDGGAVEEAYRATAASSTVVEKAIVEEEEEPIVEPELPAPATVLSPPVPEEEDASFIVKEDVVGEAMGPEVDPDDMAPPPAPALDHERDDGEECVPEFVVSADMLRAAQTNVVSAENADLFPNETRDPNINIQGLFTDLSGYNME